MKKTVKHILGAAVALAITASGAFAGTQLPLPPLPATITSPGTYKAPIANTTLTYSGASHNYQAAITIASDGVVLNLNGCTIVVPDGTAAAGIFVNVDDYNGNPSGPGINSGIAIKNGMVQTSGCDAIRVSGSLAGMNGAKGMADGVQIDHVTVLASGYNVDAIKDGGNNTHITNCILGTALPVVLPAPQFWQVPGFGVDCFRGQGETVSLNDFVLCPPGYSYRTIYPTGNLFDSTNNTDPLAGVTGDGSVSNPWMNVPKGGVQ